jgi:hypothetical protein
MITFRAWDLNDAHYLEDLCQVCADSTGIIAERDGKIVGVVMFDNWSYSAAQVHIKIEDPLVFKHGMHYEVCRYVFLHAGREQMIGLVPANNKKALKLDKHFGFKEIFRLEDGYKVGEDMVIMRMTKDECQYLTDEEKYGQVQQHTA